MTHPPVTSCRQQGRFHSFSAPCYSATCDGDNSGNCVGGGGSRRTWGLTTPFMSCKAAYLSFHSGEGSRHLAHLPTVHGHDGVEAANLHNAHAVAALWRAGAAGGSPLERRMCGCGWDSVGQMELLLEGGGGGLRWSRSTDACQQPWLGGGGGVLLDVGVGSPLQFLFASCQSGSCLRLVDGGGEG